MDSDRASVNGSVVCFSLFFFTVLFFEIFKNVLAVLQSQQYFQKAVHRPVLFFVMLKKAFLDLVSLLLCQMLYIYST